MKANELRIGNLVSYRNNIVVVSGIVGNTIYYKVDNFNDYCFDINIEGCKPFEPIPLTKEWLLKLGFDVNNRPEWIDQLKKYEIICGTTSYLKGSENSVHPIKYVHQLQNLHFDLTGEEITI